MTYPEPNEIVHEPVITLRMSSMQAAWIHKVLSEHVAKDSSENAHVKMTIDDIEKEVRRIKREKALHDGE